MGRRIQARMRLRAQTRGHANSLVRRRRRPGAEMSGNASPAREAGGGESSCARPAANRARVRSPQPDEGTAARQLTETQSGEGTSVAGAGPLFLRTIFQGLRFGTIHACSL